jgi:transposase
VSTLDHTLKPEATVVRRLEVMTGTGRRRRFSDEDKTRMIEETLAPGAVVSEVARRHGITPSTFIYGVGKSCRGTGDVWV